MLKRLRIKFIALTMVIVTLVLGATFTAVCVLDYQRSLDDVNHELIQSLNDAQNATRSVSDFLGPIQDDGLLNDPDSQQKPDAPHIGDRRGKDSMTPIAIYYVSAAGSLAISSPLSTAQLSPEVLESALDTIEASADQPAKGKHVLGTLDGLQLYYAQAQTSYGSILAFADFSATRSWENLALTLLPVGLGALLLFLVISIFFARWALRPVEAAWERQQRFVADASHELKTPLTVILANTSILRSHPASTVEEQSQWIESTQLEAERMQELVSDLLTLARDPQSSKTELQEKVDLSDLTENEALQFESVAFERSVALESSIEPAITVSGSRAQLARLIAILLDNACKHGEAGSTIRISLAKDGNRARLEVSNQGEIIPPEDLPHIFERFYQVDKARTRSDEKSGFGLGLAIAQETARAHRGTLSVESSLASGTTFTLCLPLRKP